MRARGRTLASLSVPGTGDGLFFFSFSRRNERSGATEDSVVRVADRKPGT